MRSVDDDVGVFQTQYYQDILMSTKLNRKMNPQTMPSSIEWFMNDSSWSQHHVAVCRELFGNNEPDMNKITEVQRTLLQESVNRIPHIAESLSDCSTKGGDTFFSVVHPCGKCKAHEQWIDVTTALCHSNNDSNNHNIRACSSLTTADVQIAAKCVPPHTPYHGEQPLPAAADTKADRHDSSSSMECHTCTGGTQGECKHQRLGTCESRIPGGACPPDHTSCVDVPCHRVIAPCYDHATRECVSTLDSHQPYPTTSCPAGTAKQEKLEWKMPFEPFPSTSPPPHRANKHSWLVQNNPRAHTPLVSLR